MSGKLAWHQPFEVVGKVFAKIIQRRMQLFEEDVVIDAQCGFRSGCGCIDMVFCARQLVEKAIQYNTKVSLLFVDLQSDTLMNWRAYLKIMSSPGKQYVATYVPS